MLSDRAYVVTFTQFIDQSCCDVTGNVGLVGITRHSFELKCQTRQ